MLVSCIIDKCYESTSDSDTNEMYIRMEDDLTELGEELEMEGAYSYELRAAEQQLQTPKASKSRSLLTSPRIGDFTMPTFVQQASATVANSFETVLRLAANDPLVIIDGDLRHSGYATDEEHNSPSRDSNDRETHDDGAKIRVL